jgi:glycosyltransferase involved in cell wall biosynthesis
MNRIKVCHIITMLELGGAQQNTLYTVAHLDKSKFEALLITGKGGILDNEAKAIQGVRSYFSSNLVRQLCPARDYLGFVKLWWILLRERPDIVHTHSSKAGILGRWAAKLAGVPVIIHTYHGFGFNDRQSWPVRTLYILAEKLTALVTDKFIAVSKDNIEKAEEYGIGSPENYTLIRSGIETAKFNGSNLDLPKKRKELDIPPDSQVVTTIGPFKPQKNLRDFVAAAELIAKSSPLTTFLVIGDGELRPELELQIQAAGLTGRVRLLGWRRDIPELLGATDVFVMTSLWEVLPRAILEAMSSGRPVVANAVDGVKEIVKDGETGYLTEPLEPAKTAECALKLLRDPSLAGRLGANGRKLITLEYDIDNMVRQQEVLYLGFLDKKRNLK